MNRNKIQSDEIIGYSALDLLEDCYEYCEDACMVADSIDSIKAYLVYADYALDDFQIDEIKFSDFLADFGCSCGEYALEAEALKRFKNCARKQGIDFTVETYDDFDTELPDLFKVNFSGWHNTTE